MVSGLTLVSWVAAFGLAGQARAAACPSAGGPGCPRRAACCSPPRSCAVSGSLFAGWDGEPLLVVFLGGGGLGLGLVFGALAGHLTTPCPGLRG